MGSVTTAIQVDERDKGFLYSIIGHNGEPGFGRGDGPWVLLQREGEC